MIPSILAGQYGLTALTMIRNLDGMSDDQALAPSPGGGSSANWVLGHILATRNAIHRLLGLEPALPAEQAARYARGSANATVNDPGAPLSDLLACLDRSQQAIQAALPGLGGDALAAVVELPDPLGAGPVAQHLGLFLFHESYHAGQLGVLRRAAGLGGAIS